MNLIFCLCDRVQSIEVEDISGGDSIYVQSDGEHLGFLPRKLCVLPAAIEMICWSEQSNTSDYVICDCCNHCLKVLHLTVQPSLIRTLETYLGTQNKMKWQKMSREDRFREFSGSRIMCSLNFFVKGETFILPTVEYAGPIFCNLVVF